MQTIAILWWKIRFLFYAMIIVRCSVRIGWDMATNCEDWIVDDYTPKEALMEELTYWSD